MTTATNPPDMLQSMHLQGFKGFRDTEIGPFRKVNLVLGGQNVGKTSLLEAIYFSRYLDRSIGDKFRQAEGKDLARFYDAMFGPKFEKIELGFGEVNRICVEMTDKGVHKRNYGSIGVKNATMIPVSLHLPDQAAQVSLYGQLIMQRRKRDLIKMLRQVEPQLESLEAVSPDGEQRVYAELSPVPVALLISQLGHGFNRLFVLFAQLLVADAKIILIDEVENGIHYSALPTVFKGIRDISLERGVQSIMTTHSWEAIRAAYNVFVEADALDDFQLIRLERDGDNVRAVVINDEQLVTAMESGYEIR